MGASSKYVYPRIAEYADGWFPIYQNDQHRGANGALDYAQGIALTKRAWQEAGRSGEPQFSIFGVGPDAQAVESLVELGFDRIIFALPPSEPDVVLPMLEKYAAIAHKFNNQ